MKIVADQKIPFLEGVFTGSATLIALPAKEITPEVVHDADALLTRTTIHCTEHLLNNSSVRFISTCTIGYDHIDTRYCKEHGIQWQNAPGCNAGSVGEYFAGVIAALTQYKSYNFKDKTVGIVGVGNTGKAVLNVCNALGIKTLLNDPPRARAEKENSSFVSLDTIASECDVITFHVPLYKEGEDKTLHLADTNFFSKLKKQPLIINACRGPVIDNTALYEAKQNELISDYVLDCWEKEPEIKPELLKDCAIATPHIAGYSYDGKSKATRMGVEAIANFFHININTSGIVPPAPEKPVIDLSAFDANLIEQAILHAFDPMEKDAIMRSMPDKFEWMRTHYKHPREFLAYTVINCPPTLQRIFQELGFNIES